jgi:hypothetical protein
VKPVQPGPSRPARRRAAAAIGALSLAAPVTLALPRAALAQAGATGPAPMQPAGPSPAAAGGLPAAVAAELASATLAGEGALRWFGLKVYSAQLWIDGAAPRTARIEAIPFALKLRYAMALSGAAIADRSLAEIERMGFGDAARRERWHAAMRGLFPDVARDERLTGVNRPGRGAAFFHGDRAIGSIDDAEFPAAFFAIWLDERTVAPELRRSLLRHSGRG